MPEKSQVIQLRSALHKHGHFSRIENLCIAGMPDINLCLYGREHWIEAKNLRAWPKRPETSVRLDHPFSNEQRIWFEKRLRAGGKPLLYLRVEESREFFFFSGWSAVNNVDVPDGWTRQDMIENAAFYMKGEFNDAAIIEFLSS